MYRIPTRVTRRIAIAVLCLLVAGASQAGQRVFDTPEQAVQALSDLIGRADAVLIEGVFGAGSVELFESGDPDDDRADFQRVKEMIADKVEFIEHDDLTLVALFGADGWPWPIPLVNEGGKWRFDTASGREELLNRRIGGNELQTLATLREIVLAQREYASIGRDGRPPAFARRFRSSEGKRDGLWWPEVEGEELSPLGDLLAASDVDVSKGPNPFHGYFYRILTAQGSSAPGGERSYLDADGNMRGYAVLAWPAKYGNSGIKSFVMSQRGIIYEKDLGENTEAVAAAITVFNPDASWRPASDAGQVAID